jgi:hypothetical protein
MRFIVVRDLSYALRSGVRPETAAAVVFDADVGLVP